MAKDFRRIERFLLDFIRSHGVAAIDLQGELYVGICSIADDTDAGRLVIPPGDKGKDVISVSKLARELAEELA